MDAELFEGTGLGSKAGGFNSIILANLAWTGQILELSCDISFIVIGQECINPL